MDSRLSSLRPQSTERDYARDYLFGMIEELAKMAKQAGELAIAIHLQAILEASRVAETRGST